MQALLPLLLPLIPQLIAAIPKVTSGVESLIAFIASIRTAAKQTEAWTPEMELAFTEQLIARSQDKSWQTDAERKTE